MPGKCRACDITQIYPRGIYYYKEQGYDSQQVSAMQGNAKSRVVMDENFPIGVGGEDSGYK